MTSTFESFVFAGTEWNDGTTFAFVNDGDFDPGIAPKRFRWISGADSDGALPADEAHYDNAEMTVRVTVMPQADMDTALSKVGDLVKALQECEKQPLGSAGVWTPANSTKSLTVYVVGGEIPGLPVTIESGYFAKSPTLTLKLYRRPFLYGAAVTAAATVTDSNPYQILTVASVTGDVDAEARLIITDAASQPRRHVEWGREQRYYNAATDLYIDSDNMVTSGFAGSQTTRTGAHDPGGSGNTVIRATLTTTPVAVCGLGNLSHVGTFRVKARVYADPTSDATADDFKVRLSWKEGDGPLRSNDWTSPVVVDGFSEIDLGTITIPEKALGTQRWTGQIEAYSEDPGDTLDVDYALPIPTEGYGKARAPITFETITAFTARDEFDQTAGNLAGKTAAVGGTWAGAGDADDFAVETTGKTAQRTAVSDGALASGRLEVVGATTLTNVIAQVDAKSSAAATTMQGVLLRYVDASNYLMAGFASAAPSVVWVWKVVGGTTFQLATAPYSISLGTYYTVRCVVDAAGGWALWVYPQIARESAPVLQGSDSALATGGALASGKVGIVDTQLLATANTRNYDNFIAAVASVDAVVFSGRTAEIRHDSAQRQDSTGTYYGPISAYRGDRFYLPPTGSAARTSRIIVKARRNDIDVTADDQIADSTTATVHYVPRYYVAPR